MCAIVIECYCTPARPTPCNRTPNKKQLGWYHGQYLSLSHLQAAQHYHSVCESCMFAQISCKCCKLHVCWCKCSRRSEALSMLDEANAELRSIIYVPTCSWTWLHPQPPARNPRNSPMQNKERMYYTGRNCVFHCFPMGSLRFSLGTSTTSTDPTGGA